MSAKLDGFEFIFKILKTIFFLNSIILITKTEKPKNPKKSLSKDLVILTLPSLDIIMIKTVKFIKQTLFKKSKISSSEKISLRGFSLKYATIYQIQSIQQLLDLNNILIHLNFYSIKSSKAIRTLHH